MEIRVQCGDGASVACGVHGDGNTGPVILVAPAMGVRASFYREFAERLAGLGCTVVRFDLRGNGDHSVRRVEGHDWGYQTMVSADFDAVAAQVRDQFPGRPCLLLGHSLGGQLGCLLAAARPQRLDGIVLIGSCMVDWRGWGRIGGIKRLLQYWQIGLLTRLVGYFPGERLGFAGNEPAGQMRDWVHSALTGRYEPVDAALDYEQALARLSMPVLAITFASDTYAPYAACQRLLKKMPGARVEHHDFTDQQMGESPIGHFRWAKNPDGLLPTLSQWLDKTFPR